MSSLNQIMNIDRHYSWGNPYSDSYKALALNRSSGVARPVILKHARLNGSSQEATYLAMLGIVLQTSREMYQHQASLNHLNVSPLLQLYECPGRPIAFVQPFLPNGDIITYMSRISCDRKTLIKEVAAGLAYLHLNGIVHGNVHPNNVLIDNEGHACLTDVGVHTLLWTLTRGGEIPATFTHKPAEEIIGDEFVTITKKMDIYSFGSTAYQILAGKSPFAPTYANLHRIANHGHLLLPRPHQIPSGMWDIIQRCWARDPSERPTMSEVLLALEEQQMSP